MRESAQRIRSLFAKLAIPGRTEPAWNLLKPGEDGIGRTSQQTRGSSRSAEPQERRLPKTRSPGRDDIFFRWSAEPTGLPPLDDANGEHFGAGAQVDFGAGGKVRSSEAAALPTANAVTVVAPAEILVMVGG